MLSRLWHHMLALRMFVMLLAAKLLCWLPPRDARPVWLIGERKGDALEDNGFFFFKHLLLHAPDVNCHFIVKPSRLTAIAAKVAPSRLVSYGSSRHAWLLVRASAVCYTHTHRDIVFNSLLGFLPSDCIKVFLQHGVTAFKKLHRDYLENAGVPDLIVSVSRAEKCILQTAGLDGSKIVVTGFPRHDFLSNGLSLSASRKIAYLPTWRDWIDAGDIIQSRFFRHVSSLLDSKELLSLLQRSDLRLTIYLHVNMRDVASMLRAPSPHIEVVGFGDQPAHEIISQADCLITDYSSVAWDFLFQRKPVVFYQFDRAEYLAFRGSYVDLETTAFGPVVNTEAEVVDAISHVIADGFKLHATHEAVRRLWFDNIDNCSSERLKHRILAASMNKRVQP